MHLACDARLCIVPTFAQGLLFKRGYVELRKTLHELFFAFQK